MDTRIHLISTAYLPTIRYMAFLAKYETVAIEQYETFPKQTFRNRTVIATGNGELMLNVPVTRPNGNHTVTADMAVSYHEPWNIRHWRAIVSAYNAAPYFLYYKDELESILLKEHEKLIELNDAILRYLLNKMKIACSLEYTKDYQASADNQQDYRYTLTAKKATLSPTLPPYSQVFESRFGFQQNLSAIDLLFNLGPESKRYLLELPDEAIG